MLTAVKPIRVSDVFEIHYPHQSLVSVDRHVTPYFLTGYTANVMEPYKTVFILFYRIFQENQDEILTWKIQE